MNLKVCVLREIGAFSFYVYESVLQAWLFKVLVSDTLNAGSNPFYSLGVCVRVQCD